jgi:glycosyltransferase involved in cell wall biosynthesis
MRIGINASFVRKPNTGIGQVTLNFLKKLSNFQFSIFNFQDLEFVLYLEENLPSDVKLPENFTKRIVLPFWKRDDLIRAMWRDKYTLPKQIKKDKCDVFINLYQSAVILPKEIKHIMVVHDIILELFPEYLNNSRKKLFWKLTKKAIRKADKIIAISRRTEKDLILHLGIAGENIAVGYLDISNIFKNEVSQKKSEKVLKKYKLNPGYILAGGGMEVRKNVEGVIRAYKSLHKSFELEKSLPKLAIYGKLMPELAPLVTDAEALIKDLNLTQRVKLLGQVPQEDLPALYKNAEFFIYPSKYEGFGLPVLEAMNLGTPVITSKTSSLPEVGGDAVLYCNPSEVHDISMVLRNLLLNKHLRDALSERGKIRAAQFSWDKFAEKMFYIIENLK